MYTMDALEAEAQQGMAALDALLLPIDTALAGWPEVRVSADTAFYLKTGPGGSGAKGAYRGPGAHLSGDDFLPSGRSRTTAGGTQRLMTEADIPGELRENTRP